MPDTPRIEDYALIGDLQTAALVSRAGSIDWCCFPRFDSGACFAALLGDPRHGRWLLAPAGASHSTRRYRHDTLILESIYETDEGRIRAIDFMPPRGVAPDIVRIVEGLDGEVRIQIARRTFFLAACEAHDEERVRELHTTRRRAGGAPYGMSGT